MYIEICIIFFFFKQKTAYEMRISDWSSDVCSSDLQLPFLSPVSSCNPKFGGTDSSSKLSAASMKASILRSRPASPTRPLALPVSKKRRRPLRSEEHTSELQSLMRISYAVFCLKKKNKKHQKKLSITK